MNKLAFSMLVIWSIGHVSAQQIQTDSTTNTKIILNDLIVEGNFYTDPTFVIEVINQQQETMQPKNVSDLFRRVNGMNFIKRGNYAIDPSFRASQYDQLNIQYDGGVKAMHACPNRMDPVTTHVLPEEIDKIEIIKGPYSVRYGSNFAGVINLVTKRPSKKNKGIEGNIKAGYETNGNTWVTAAGLQYTGSKFHINANVGYRDFGNYKDGNGTEIPSSFKSTDYGVGAGYNLSSNQHLMLHWRQSFGRDILHAGLPMDTQSDDSSIFSVGYTAKELEGMINQINTKVYLSTVDHLMTNNSKPNFMMMEMASQVYADTYGGRIEIKWNAQKQYNIFTGLDAIIIDRDGTRAMKPKKDMQGNPINNPMVMKSDIWQNATVKDLGIFSEGNFNYTNNLVFKAGLRLDFVTGEAKKLAENFKVIYSDLDKNNDVNISGHMGVKFSSSSKSIWEFAIGRGVRSANMTERFINYFFVGQDRYAYVGNPNLKPEINHQIELGYKNEIYTEGLSKFEYGFSIYYSKLTDYISAVVNPDLITMMQPNVKSYVNIDDAYKTGFETYIQSRIFNHWTLGADLSYVYTQNVDLDEALPLTPPLKLGINVGYGTPNIKSTLRYLAVSKQNNLAESFSESETPGYGVLDFEMIYSPISSLSIGCSLLNILDKTYHNHQNFSFINQSEFNRVPINEPGRNFTIFTRYNF